MCTEPIMKQKVCVNIGKLVHPFRYHKDSIKTAIFKSEREPDE